MQGWPADRKTYRVWVCIEESEEFSGYEGRLIEKFEMAAFQSLEEAFLYRYELAQKYSPQITGEVDVIQQMTTPEAFSAGD